MVFFLFIIFLLFSKMFHQLYYIINVENLDLVNLFIKAVFYKYEKNTKKLQKYTLLTSVVVYLLSLIFLFSDVFNAIHYIMIYHFIQFLLSLLDLILFIASILSSMFSYFSNQYFNEMVFFLYMVLLLFVNMIILAVFLRYENNKKLKNYGLLIGLIVFWSMIQVFFACYAVLGDHRTFIYYGMVFYFINCLFKLAANIIFIESTVISMLSYFSIQHLNYNNFIFFLLIIISINFTIIFFKYFISSKFELNLNWMSCIILGWWGLSIISYCPVITPAGPAHLDLDHWSIQYIYNFWYLCIVQISGEEIASRGAEFLAQVTPEEADSCVVMALRFFDLALIPVFLFSLYYFR